MHSIILLPLLLSALARAEGETCVGSALDVTNEIMRRSKVVRLPGASGERVQHYTVMAPGPDGNYLTVPLIGRYRQREMSPEVVYLNAEQRALRRVRISNGRLTSQQDGIIDSSSAMLGNEASPASIFVMSRRGEIYVSNDRRLGVFHHSSFLAGDEVAAAGEMIIEDGRIRRITLCSGHYKPPAWMMNQILGQLRRAGADLSDITLRAHCQ